MVPRKHTLLSIPVLEAEASGLLDRLLSIFQEDERLVVTCWSTRLYANSNSNPILLDATLSCLSILIRTRPAIANKIISALLNFHPLKMVKAPMTPRSSIIAESLERTTRAVLKNVNKHNPHGAQAAKIDAYLVHLTQTRHAAFATAPSLKRPAPSDSADELGVKRTKVDGPPKYPAMPPPPNSFAQLFTLTQDAAFINFDVRVLTQQMVQTIAYLTLHHVDTKALEHAVAAVRERYSHLQKIQQPYSLPEVPLAGPTGVDDEDDYDPELSTTNDPVVPSTTISAAAAHELLQPDLALGPFELPKPPVLSTAEAAQLATYALDRVFANVASSEPTPKTQPKQLSGINRIAANANDRDTWMTMLNRTATRAPPDFETATKLQTLADKEDMPIKVEVDTSQSDLEKPSLANGIRQKVYFFVLEDFRSRLNIAISWLNEEWYNDRVRNSSLCQQLKHPTTHVYNFWTLRLLDALLPYLDARDSRLLIRFLSEIPAISLDVLDRVKSLAQDPERVNMCIMALQYLVLMRPPVRDAALDTIQRIWENEDEFREAHAATAKVLMRWRPDVLEPSKVVKKESPVESPSLQKLDGWTGADNLSHMRDSREQTELMNGPGNHNTLDNRTPLT